MNKINLNYRVLSLEFEFIRNLCGTFRSSVVVSKPAVFLTRVGGCGFTYLIIIIDCGETLSSLIMIKVTPEHGLVVV